MEATIKDCFERYNVVAFYADPSGWTGQVADWEATYGRKLRVKASREAPIAMWPRGKTNAICNAVEEFRRAIIDREVAIQDDPTLIAHFLHARRRTTRTGYLLYKPYPDSPDKIDAAYAATMAYMACLDATRAGATRRPKPIKRGRVVMA